MARQNLFLLQQVGKACSPGPGDLAEVAVKGYKKSLERFVSRMEHVYGALPNLENVESGTKLEYENAPAREAFHG